MRKFLSVALAMVLMLSMGVSALAQEKENVTVGYSDSTFVETDISYDEYIDRLAEDKNISRQEAVDFNNLRVEAYKASLSKDKLSLQRAGSSAYKEVSFTRAHPKNSDFVMELSATIQLFGSTQYYDIVDILGISTSRNSGVYEYDWNEGHNWSNPASGASSFPGNKVVFGATGKFQVIVSESVSAGLDIPGFSVGGSVGSDVIYYSTNMSPTFTYRLYN